MMSPRSSPASAAGVPAWTKLTAATHWLLFWESRYTDRFQPKVVDTPSTLLVKESMSSVSIDHLSMYFSPS